MYKKAPILLLLSIIILLIPTPGTITTNQTDELPVSNIILMIGDGMGFNHLKVASYVEYGTPDGLFMQSTDLVSHNITTYAANAERTDSAASGTAIATGYKTDNGRVSQFPNGTDITPTILEIAEQLNKSTGLVTTTRYNHATPAVFAVHESSRNSYAQIAQDMLTKDIELIFGGGEVTLPSADFITDNNYTLIKTRDELESANTTRILGVFGVEHLEYEYEMDYSTDVRIGDMVPVALDILKDDEDGFFLMIESGRIDHASHNRDVPGSTLETIQFDYAIKQVIDFMDDYPDTLLIVVADHETGGLVFDGTGTLDTDLPSNYVTPEERRTRRLARTEQLDAVMPTTGHTAAPVPFFAYGKGANDLIDTGCLYSNANVFAVMKNAFDGIVPTECPEYIEGFNDPDINDSPDGFRPSPKPTTSSDTEETPMFFIYPLIATYATIVLLNKNKR